MREVTQLRQWIFEDKTAEGALDFIVGVLAGEVEHGFAYTPARAFFCTLRHEAGPGFFGRMLGSRAGQSRLVECDGSDSEKPVELGAVFELRLFGARYEVRWERTSGAKGILAICSDSEADAQSGNGRRCEKLGAPADRPAFVRDHLYLLWGEPAGSQPRPGRTRLTSARIGKLWAPANSGGGRVVLTAREYFETKEFGNVVFAGERLTGLSAASSMTPPALERACEQVL
jgi:CRISPR-associated protein (TIGR03984 family)